MNTRTRVGPGTPNSPFNPALQPRPDRWIEAKRAQGEALYLMDP